MPAASSWPPSPETAPLSAAAPDLADDNRPLPPQRRLFLMIVTGLFVSTFASDSRIAQLPLQFLLKNHLHVTPLQMSAFFGLTGLAWYFKPLAGLLSDVVPFFGTRRRAYFVLSGLAGGILWAVLGTMPHRYGPLVWTLVAINVFGMLASSVSGGLLVEAGQRSGWTGRMGSLRETIIAGTYLLAQPVGGYLVGHAFGLTCGIGAALFLGLVPAALLWLPERPAPRAAPGDVGRAIRRTLKPVLASRVLWLAVLFSFLKELSPGFTPSSTPLFYFQTNVLHFSPTFIGWTKALFNGAQVLGALLYGYLCLRLPLSRMLSVSLVLNALGILLYLGFHSHATAIAVQAGSGLLQIFAAVALMDLAARATPRGGEAMAYSLLMSAGNLALTLSDILGSWLYGTLHVSLHALVLISAGATLLTLFAIPLIPRAVLETADQHGAAPAR